MQCSASAGSAGPGEAIAGDNLCVLGGSDGAANISAVKHSVQMFL